MRARIGGTLAGMVLMASVAQAQQAGAILRPTDGSSVQGTIQMKATDGGVRFTGTVSGLEPGLHGFHIHEHGDCSAPDGSSAGAHFDPGRRRHGSLVDGERHAGDLGNIEADSSGSATVDLFSEQVALGAEARSILGKAIIVHAGPDDSSQPSGAAGDRMACGIIK